MPPAVTAPARPKRIQRKRTKGWRMPTDAVYVGRPTKWGNPFRVGSRISDVDPAIEGMFNQGQPLAREGVVEDAEHAVELYRAYVLLRVPFALFEVDRELGGHDLACWCRAGQPCHGDVLLEIANEARP